MRLIEIWLYNTSLQFYALGIWITSFFSFKAKLWREGRKDWQKNVAQITKLKGKRIWFHCASLGEFEQARPVIEKYGCANQGDSIILTFFSPSGYEVRKDYDCVDAVLYLPLDTASNAKKFLDIVKPDVALFVKYEFWFHYLYELKQRNIPVILFSAVFRKDQIFFKWYGALFRDMLRYFTCIFVQSQPSEALLSSIGIKAEVAFDTRFDRVKQIAESNKSFPAIEIFKGDSKIFISGSTWPKDEELIVACLNNDVIKGYKYVIAPHDVSLSRINSLQKQIRVRSVLFSELSRANAAEADVLIVDSIGQLAFIYRYADIAYVGGGFDASVHNILEAAVYGMPVIFATQFYKSIEACELIDKQGAFSISSYAELFSALRLLTVNNSLKGKEAGEIARKYVAERFGGTDKVLGKLERLVAKS